ncbi:MAG: hypothetical protein C0417_04415 [Chlorobiaceae bacterium]|nr:hypothetical protein [Chlorobiaceae bacterium]
MKGNKLNINDPMPEFKNLPCVDGKKYSSSNFNDVNILIIVFSCNHCPYVKAYEDRMIAVQKDYSDRGVQLVAINSNDERNYPDDNFDEMIKRAKAKEFNFKYLRDVDQQTAEAFGATHTPQFLFTFNPFSHGYKSQFKISSLAMILCMFFFCEKFSSNGFCIN